jgi:chemotaxis protein CheX
MDKMVQYIKPFVDVTVNTFENFVGCEVAPRHPHFLDVNKETEGDISSVIGLSGAIKGAVILSMKEGLSIKITELLVGTTPTGIDADVVDAVGELVNIIAGNVKPMIPNGDRIVISIPTVIKGKEHSIAWPSKQARILCIPFKAFEEDIFHLFVAIELDD